MAFNVHLPPKLTGEPVSAHRSPEARRRGAKGKAAIRCSHCRTATAVLFKDAWANTRFLFTQPHFWINCNWFTRTWRRNRSWWDKASSGTWEMLWRHCQKEESKKRCPLSRSDRMKPYLQFCGHKSAPEGSLKKTWTEICIFRTINLFLRCATVHYSNKTSNKMQLCKDS